MIFLTLESPIYSVLLKQSASISRGKIMNNEGVSCSFNWQVNVVVEVYLDGEETERVAEV